MPLDLAQHWLMDVQLRFDICRFQRVEDGHALIISLFSDHMEFWKPLGERRVSRAISEQEAWREIGRVVPGDLHRCLGVEMLQPVPLPPMPARAPQPANPTWQRFATTTTTLD